MSNLLEHPADLAIAAFGKSDLVPGIIALAHDLNLRGQSGHGKGSPALARTLAAFALRHRGLGRKLDAGAEAIELLFTGLSADLDEISLGYVRGRGGQLLHQIAVVGKQ